MGKIQYAVVPEPFATVACEKDKNIFRAVDFQKEFFVLSGIENFPMTVIAVNANFAKSNPEKVKKFLEEYKKASEWTLKNPKEAGILAEKANFGLKADVAEKSIPNANFIWQDSLTAKKQIESILSVFLQESPQSTGGKLPDDDFYFSLK